MNIDGTQLSDLFEVNNINTKNASVQTNSAEIVNGAGAFFDDETVIKKAENVGDDYDRIISKADTSKTGNMAVTPDTVKQISDVVTPENYSKYEELGIEPDKDNPAEILTVSERIEIELAANCDSYVPTGNIDENDLKKMYGSLAPQIKDTIEKAVNLKEITRESSAYLLSNNMELSIDNIYMAEHSVNHNYTEKHQELNDSQWKELQPQIEKMLNENGLDVDTENLDNAKWLVEQKIPVTADNMFKMAKIDEINKNIENGTDESVWLANIQSNLMYGLSAGNTSADYYSTVKADSVEAVEIINNGTEEQVASLVLDGKQVTLLNMKRAEEDNTREANQKREENISDEEKRQIIADRKNLEELRLKMTVEASAMMIKNGINISITPLADLVENLKDMEASYASAMFEATGNTPSAEDIELFSSTSTYMSAFTNIPAYVLGNVLSLDIEFNIEAMTTEGNVRENVLKTAEQAYDTLGTKPDRELGDSLKKAFAGINDILGNLGLEDSIENERSVRILAYNQMEITTENIAEINEMDMQVTRLIENLTPKTTAYLIANGINPLKTDISKLNDEIDDINEAEGITDSVEKYSEFLWKLDKNKEISEEDREAYIGVYRLINMIEKGDRRAVGAVIKQGSELTLKNLLTAARSIRQTGRDVKIDDEFGVLDSLKLSKSNIDNQLSIFESSAYTKRAKEVVSPEVIKKSVFNENKMDISMEEFIKNIADSDNLDKEELDKEEYARNEMKVLELDNLRTISEETFRNICQDGTDTSMQSFMGLAFYAINKGKSYAKLSEACDDEAVDKTLQKIADKMNDEEVTEADGDKNHQEAQDIVESVKEEISNLSENIKDALLNKSQINISELRQINSMAGYIKRSAENNSFYIPTEIDGQMTSVKVTIDTKSQDKGRVAVNMYTRAGKVSAEFSLKHNSVNGLVCVEKGALKNIEGFDREMSESVKKLGLQLNVLNITDNSYETDVSFGGSEGESTSTNMMFNLAKQCISGVKKCLSRTDK